MRLRIGDRTWWLRFVPDLPDPGQCDAPSQPGKEIRIREGQGPLERLDTIIHEVTHARFWDLAEESVAEFGTDLARILRRLGLRWKGEGGQ